jgi:3-dehydroquinate synthase
MTLRLELDAANGSYPILIGAGLLERGAEWKDLVPARRGLIVSDGNVAPLYAEALRAALSPRSVGTHLVAAGESAKSLESAGAVFQALAELGAGRDACLFALGGGVVGDLAGFAAACWMRGIDYVQVPTTLLAMVDSSVGGKTAVNLPQGKNLVGAFHQPRLVLADLDTLETLPEGEYRAGLGEVVKYGALGDAAFFSWLERNAEALLAREQDALAETVQACCRAKAAIVSRDPREQGERALLNFGHSFAHGLESVTGYGTLRHGEAVAIGMALAARLSARLGRSTDADADRLERLLQRFGLATRPPDGVDPAAVLAAMRLDKKNLAGRLRLILWRGVGRAEIVPDVAEDGVLAILSSG